jgi:pyrroline-5-carboxylate reductase
MKVCIIGAGNIGGAIVEGCVKQAILKTTDIVVSDPNPNVKEKFMRKNIAVYYVDSNAVAVEDADLIIVAVKPWLVEKVMLEISDVINRKKQVIVSIAAGVAFAQLKRYLSVEDKGGVAIYRIIPNVAVSVAKGVSFIAKYHTSEQHDELVHALFDELGEVFYIEEYDMRACTALSSAGIAYALQYIDASMRGGERLGLKAEKALRIVTKTVDGALALLEANGTEPQTEIDKVTTRGGITYKGLERMELGEFSRTVIEGLLATK